MVGWIILSLVLGAAVFYFIGSNITPEDVDYYGSSVIKVAKYSSGLIVFLLAIWIGLLVSGYLAFNLYPTRDVILESWILEDYARQQFAQKTFLGSSDELVYVLDYKNPDGSISTMTLSVKDEDIRVHKTGSGKQRLEKHIMWCGQPEEPNIMYSLFVACSKPEDSSTRKMWWELHTH